MCGIAGYIGKRSGFPKAENIENCLKKMHLRRGPDSYGKNFFHKNDYSCLFLHARLALVDNHERSNQPFEDNEGILIFNGEIYNYLELRDECKKYGTKFLTHSDTEVLLKVLNIFGVEKGLQKIDGDWALAYYNKKTDKVFISKDRFSIRPLYFYEDKNGFYFMSSIPHGMSLLGKKFKMRFERIANYLSFGFKATNVDPETFFHNFEKFPSAKYLEFDKGTKKTFKRYWKKSIIINDNLNYNESTNLIRETIINSVKRRLRTDRKIGCSLSAGIDSSIIAGIAKKILKKDIKLYSYTPNRKDYDESDLISLNIENLKAKHMHKYVTLPSGNPLKILSDIILEAGLPFNSPSDWLFHTICKNMKDDNCTAFFTGSAGDDLFSGNFIDHLNYLVSIFKDKKKFEKAYINWNKKIKPLIRSPHLRDFNSYLRKVKNDTLASWHEKELVNNYLNFDIPNIKEKLNHYSDDYFRNELCRNVFDAAVPAHLSSNDQISMFSSLEGRYPFLSHEVYELANSIPSDFLLKDATTKSVLRDAFKDILPKKIYESKNKIGFFMDFKEIFKTHNKEFEDMLFQHNELNQIIKIDKIRDVLKSDDQPIMSNQKLIFSLLNISIMMQEYKW